VKMFEQGRTRSFAARARRALSRMTGFCLLAGLFSCGTGLMAKRPYPPASPAAILDQLRKRQGAITGADLETRTTSWLQGQRTRASVFMLIDRPGRLRFEAEVALQGTVATLITDGTNFSLADFQSHQAKQGQACPENVASLIPVPLQPDEIAAILLGDAPISPDAEIVGTTWDPKAAADVVEIENRKDGTATTHLWITLRPAQAPERIDVLAVEGGTPEHRSHWRVQFDQREIAGEAGYRQPNLIKFAEPGRSFDDGVEVKVKSRKINPTFRDKVFTPTPPDGFPVESVPCCPGCKAALSP
jgi:hypothetical protein